MAALGRETVRIAVEAFRDAEEGRLGKKFASCYCMDKI